MTANRINAGSDWLGYAETPDWTKRFGETASKVRDALAAGLGAAHDYKTLSSRGLAPQAASETVFRKHFGKR